MLRPESEIPESYRPLFIFEAKADYLPSEDLSFEKLDALFVAEAWPAAFVADVQSMLNTTFEESGFELLAQRAWDGLTQEFTTEDEPDDLPPPTPGLIFGQATRIRRRVGTTVSREDLEMSTTVILRGGYDDASLYAHCRCHLFATAADPSVAAIAGQALINHDFLRNSRNARLLFDSARELVGRGVGNPDLYRPACRMFLRRVEQLAR